MCCHLLILGGIISVPVAFYPLIFLYKDLNFKHGYNIKVELSRLRKFLPNYNFP